MDELISKRMAIDTFKDCAENGVGIDGIVDALESLPPAQPEQLEQCPMYDGVCAYPSDHCYECPRHYGAQPEQRWTPVTERLPENRDWVLGIFQEGDTGWINPIPFICDYVGKKTPITTQDNWLLKMVDEPHPYYERLHCIAWMPLPEPWKGEVTT